MAIKNRKPAAAAKPMSAKKAPRQSVTFPAKTYAELERLSREKKVSIAWVVREAAEQYIAGQYPLFGREP